MRSKVRRFTLISHVLMVLMLLVTACSGGGGGSQGQAKPASNKPKYGGELKITRSSSITYMDPQKASGGNDPFIYWIYSGFLMEVSMEGELQPSIAESWSIPDPKTINIKLRPGVKFHDGTNVDSAAVKYNIQRGQDAKTNSPLRPQYMEITQVDTPDPLNVTLHLANPNAGLLYILRGGAGPLVSPAAVEKWGKDFELHVVSAGPFQLEKYVPDAELVFKKFDDYFGKDAEGNKLPYLDRIVVKFITDSTVAISALESGDTEVDGLVDAKYADQIQANKDLTLVTVPKASMHFINPYKAKAPLDNADLRKAIAYAINRDEIAKSVYSGRAAPGVAAVPPISWAFDKSLEGYTYNPDKAKEYLAKAGYPNGIKLKAAQYSTTKDMAVLVQAQLKKVGIDMTIDMLDLVTFQKNFRTEGQYDLGFVSISTTNADPDQGFSGWYGSDGYYNPGKPKNPELDKLIEQGRTTYDLNERKRIYSQLLKRINDDAFNIFVVDPDRFMAHRNYVRGFSPASTSVGDVRWCWLDK